MRNGVRTREPVVSIDYKALRKVNAEAARKAVLEYLKRGSVSSAARVFGITRAVVYDIIRKEREGDLKDRPRAPRHQPSKTPAAVEERVLELKNRTRLGPERLSRYLDKHEGILVPPGTIRHVLARNRHRLHMVCDIVRERASVNS